MKVNFDAAKPIYEQIIDQIKKMIVRGELKPGDKLPSQREMAKEIEVNPNTIQRAYREMESMQIVETRRGMGTFISENNKIINQINNEMVTLAINRFINEMISLGISPEEIISRIESELKTRE